MYRLDASDGDASFDWSVLQAAHEKAMTEYRRDRDHDYWQRSAAVTALKDAGVVAALEMAVPGIAAKRAAAIFNDFGYLASEVHKDPATAEAALRRPIALDPERSVAYLNLADMLRAELPAVTDVEAKRAGAKEAASLYRAHLSRHGRKTAAIEDFLAARDDDSGSLPICAAVARLANTGQLQNFVADKALDVAVNGHRYDVIFTTEGTAHLPVWFAFDAATDAPASLHVEAPWYDQLWGGDQLGLFVDRRNPQLIHFRDSTHPVHTAPLAGGAACEFSAPVTQIIAKDALEPRLCQALVSRWNPDPIVFTENAKIDADRVTER